MNKKRYVPIIGTGLAAGIIAVLLVYMGNPGNMGFCIACFIRDEAGALGLHSAANLQYMRPEVPALVIGAFLASFHMKEFKASGGSSPFTRFILGMFVVFGAMMFLGCPLRMALRLGGGDLNAVFGLIGFVIGILAGVFCLKKGFSLRRAYKQSNFEGFVFTGLNIFMLLLFFILPSLFLFSEKGPGSMHAPAIAAVIGGIVLGILAYKSRLCMAGGIRDAFMFKDFYLLAGFISIVIASFAGNLITGSFHLSMEGQPIAHTSVLWNILGMVLVGFASVLLGGCPFRQLILAGSGNSDSAVTFMGFLAGGALSHTLNIASSPAGPTLNGKAAVIIGIAVTALIAYFNIRKDKK